MYVSFKINVSKALGKKLSNQVAYFASNDPCGKSQFMKVSYVHNSQSNLHQKNTPLEDFASLPRVNNISIETGQGDVSPYKPLR